MRSGLARDNARAGPARRRRAGATELYVTRLDATAGTDLFEESGLDDEAFAAQVVFGRVPGQNLVEILEGLARQAFIAPFRARIASERAFAAALGHEVGAAALDELTAADRRRTDALRDAPMPAACAGCHKARGY